MNYGNRRDNVASCGTLCTGVDPGPLSGCQQRLPSQCSSDLIHSVIQDEVEKVKALLDQGGDPNARVAPAAEDKWAIERVKTMTCRRRFSSLRAGMAPSRTEEYIQMLARQRRRC